MSDVRGALRRQVVLSPFGVHPARSGGHSAVLEPARALARDGASVRLFGYGIRRFEVGRRLRSFVRTIEPRLVEERLVSWRNVLDYVRRGRSGLPPVDAGAVLRQRASDALRRACKDADVVQYECPWLWPFVAGSAPRVLIAHNAESLMLRQLAIGTSRERAAAAALEQRAWEEADLVICFTEEDRAALRDEHGDRDAHVVPLGVDCEQLQPPDPDERATARARLGLGDEFVVLFCGAWHLPNRAASDAMRSWARARVDRDPPRLHVVAGTVCRKREAASGLLVTGPIPEMRTWFAAADCCVNPVVTGSGANVKILEYLAMGLPVVSTPFGARGVAIEDRRHALICDLDDIPEALDELQRNADLCCDLGRAGRQFVCTHRTWSAIAARRRELIDVHCLGGAAS